MVVHAARQQVKVSRMQRMDKGSGICPLCRGVFKCNTARQSGSGLCSVHLNSRMYKSIIKIGRRRKPEHVGIFSASYKHKTAKQRRGGVVSVRAAAHFFFSGNGEGQKLSWRKAQTQQPVNCSNGCGSARRTGTKTAVQWDALFDNKINRCITASHVL